MNEAPDCGQCPLERSCIWTELKPEPHERLLEVLRLRTLSQRGRQLFRVGDPLKALYILRSGSVKTWNVSEEGEDHIIRFYMPGDVLGLGAISSGSYDCNATTLDTCSVCEIPFNRFQRLAEDLPALNQQLLRMMSRELVQEEQMNLLRSNRSASARIASFLNHLAYNQGSRGYSTKDFNLTMGRREIANYLGLALETVSRTLSQFQDEGLLRVDGKHITVMDAPRLSERGYRQRGPAALLPRGAARDALPRVLHS
jgi:CRP/FNR family transcriptional regulator